ncbi:nucleic acid-binding protein [Athelia psychrophila]|uniref:Nucleic acid-binding protein n=1 Tax=Athelia psychrophila TaxID=1759441 RepID=A0A166JVD4_9AGAM|nr:nucleic acid-binding protein [Fibularhizoctonia sp. CBS 109695]
MGRGSKFENGGAYSSIFRGIPKYEPFGELYVEEQEWETLKQTGEQIDNRIVKVHRDSSKSCWRMMGFRDDKPNGNFKRVVDDIMKSIEEGVEKEELLARSAAIRDAWNARHGGPPGSSAGPPGPPAPALHLHRENQTGLDDLEMAMKALQVHSDHAGPPAPAPHPAVAVHQPPPSVVGGEM